MERIIKADGDRWAVRLSDRSSGDDVRALVFFCRTTDQRPYRVVEVPRERLDDESDLEAFSEQELLDLFGSSRSMDFPREYA